MSKFIRCGVCDYLRHQIDICPREHSEYLNALVKRLGSHYDMQSAQRLAQVACRSWLVAFTRSDSRGATCTRSGTGKASPSPVLLIPSHEIPLIAAWRPTVTQHAYSETDQRSKVMMVANWAADTRPTSSYRGRAPRVLVVQQARKGDLLHGQVVAGRSQHTRLGRG